MSKNRYTSNNKDILSEEDISDINTPVEILKKGQEKEQEKGYGNKINIILQVYDCNRESSGRN
jgi:hypothetical protein